MKISEELKRLKEDKSPVILKIYRRNTEMDKFLLKHNDKRYYLFSKIYEVIRLNGHYVRIGGGTKSVLKRVTFSSLLKKKGNNYLVERIYNSCVENDLIIDHRWKK